MGSSPFTVTESRRADVLPDDEGPAIKISLSRSYLSGFDPRRSNLFHGMLQKHG